MQTTQLLLLAQHIRLYAPMPMICFFDGTKWEMIVINYLPYQLIQTYVKIVKPAYDLWETQLQASLFLAL